MLYVIYIHEYFYVFARARAPFFEGDVRKPDGERARADEQQREVDRQGEDHRDLQPVAPEPCIGGRFGVKRTLLELEGRFRS